MSTAPFVYFSNRVEILYENLREILFDPAQSTLFTRRLIIVPSPAMKAWLMLRMAQDPQLGVATGIKVVYLNEGLEELWSDLCSAHAFKLVPRTLELSFAIEQLIKRKIGTADHAWGQVIHYLSSGSSHKKNRRLASLADQLAQLFIRYGNYGGRCLKDWEEASAAEGWQIQLWNALYREFPQWTNPYQKISSAQFVSEKSDDQVHLFAMSFVSQLHFSFFETLSKQVAVHLWVMSPCQAFWSDLCSDKEKRRLRAYWQKKQVSANQLGELEHYLRDRNPLLANFGRLGRQMATQIEESNAIVNGLFELPQSILNIPAYEELYYEEIFLRDSQHPLTLLEALQADLVLLRNPVAGSPQTLQEKDNSLQVHSSSSRWREIQVLHDTLLTLVAAHRHDEHPITPAQIIVMAPDIREYEPYIKVTFGADVGQLDYQMMDLPMQSQNPLAQAFLQLIALPQSRWEASSVFDLFQHSAFSRRQGLKREDIDNFREWIQKFGVKWGATPEHRQELFLRDYGIEDREGELNGTWEQGWSGALRALAIDYSDEWTISFPESALLGKVIHLYRKLRVDLRKLENHIQMPLDEWADYLRYLAETYLSALEEDFESFDDLLSLFDKFKEASSHLEKEEFPFASIQLRLLNAMERKDFSYRENHLQTVRFCSMLPMRAVPAQVVVLLGMHEGAYPRKDFPYSLNLLNGNPRADYSPSQTDYDRYLFLEALLSARRYFILSYCDYSPSDPKPLPAAIVISELLNYIDQNYLCGAGKPSLTCLKRHPFHPFDFRYFSEGTGLKSYSQQAFEQARAFYHIPKQPSHCFIEHFPPHEPSNFANIQVLDLAELANILSHPLRHYLNKRLGIYLERKSKREIPDDEKFDLESWNVDELVMQGLRKPLDEVLKLSEKKGLLPAAPFKNLVCAKIGREIDEMKERLQERVYSVEFNLQCKTHSQNEKGDLILPPLTILLDDGSKVLLTGKIPLVCSKGVFYNGKREFAKLIKLLPTYLAFYAADLGDNVFFADLKRQKKPFDQDPLQQLQQLIEYCNGCSEQASPLLKSWTRPIMQGNEKKLTEEMEKSLEGEFSAGDAYLNWAYRTNRFPDAVTIIEEWHAKGKTLFGAMDKYWFER